MTSVWSIHSGAQESLECKPVTFGCSRVSGPGKWPIPGSWAWELQFPPGQQIPNPECTKEPVLRSYCVNTVMLNVKEMPSSSLHWEWGDATACKQLGALSVGPDSVLGTRLTLQTISLKYPRTLTLPLCPSPLSFSEEDNPQALSFKEFGGVLFLGRAQAAHGTVPWEDLCVPRSSSSAKRGWWQVSNSRELHLGAGMEQQFHLTNWKLKYYNPAIYC